MADKEAKKPTVEDLQKQIDELRAIMERNGWSTK